MYSKPGACSEHRQCMLSARRLHVHARLELHVRSKETYDQIIEHATIEA